MNIQKCLLIIALMLNPTLYYVNIVSLHSHAHAHRPTTALQMEVPVNYAKLTAELSQLEQ